MFCYCRKLFHASDGGTFALDWLLSADGKNNLYAVNLAVFFIHISSTCKLVQACMRTHMYKYVSIF